MTDLSKAEVADRYLGRKVLVGLTNSRNAGDRMLVLCYAREVRLGYGAVRVKVEPVEGTGHLWVSAARIQNA